MNTYIFKKDSDMDYEKAQKINETMAQLIGQASEKSPVDSDGIKKDVAQDGELQTCLFKNSPLRRKFHKNEWFFSVSDIVQAVLETEDSKSWGKIKSRLKQEGSQVAADCEPLKLPGKDGKLYLTDCANVEAIFRILQSIPSERVEPFKRWLARMGYERIQEYQNPEIAIKRSIAIYRAQGHTDDWIKNRINTIISRKLLTDEWKNRGIEKGIKYAILTNKISKETFGKTTGEHGKYKNLSQHHNLRDHMNGMELVLTMLGEESTKEIAIKHNAQGLSENMKAARAGGAVAGSARKAIEIKTGTTILSKDNFLPEKKRTEKLFPEKNPKIDNK